MKRIKTIIKTVRDEVDKEIGSFARSGDSSGFGHISRGLASEGYNGGYRDALEDVMLAMRGIFPNQRHWWDKVKEQFEK